MEKQKENPFNRQAHRPDMGDVEWGYQRRRDMQDDSFGDGWSSPGRPSEWNPPRRHWDDEDLREDRSSRRKPMKGDDFRRGGGL